jgi:hypothetical protein
MMAEMGIFMDRVLILLLETPSCSAEQKKEIIGIFAHIMLSPKAMVNVFYNYDTDYKVCCLFEIRFQWKVLELTRTFPQGLRIFERLIAVLAKIVQGTQVGSDPSSSGSHSPHALSAAAANGNAPSREAFDFSLEHDTKNSLNGQAAPGHTSLQKVSLRLVVQIMQALAQWVGVPGLPGLYCLLLFLATKVANDDCVVLCQGRIRRAHQRRIARPHF